MLNYFFDFVFQFRDKAALSNGLYLARRQVFSVHGSSGPYIRKKQNQLLLGLMAASRGSIRPEFSPL
jgi:hypothetical protein